MVETLSLNIVDLRFEHHLVNDAIGIQEANPRVSWRVKDPPQNFLQTGYELKFSSTATFDHINDIVAQVRVEGSASVLVPWPLERPLNSRERLYCQVRLFCDTDPHVSNWSDVTFVEAGLLHREDWKCKRISASWKQDVTVPRPEELYRKQFLVPSSKKVTHARLYVTAQGVYEVEINAHRVGNDFMAPGWSAYDRRIHYQTYDVLDLLSANQEHNCIGVRVAEGWFCGRLSFPPGQRNIWGDHTALMAQLELAYADGTVERIVTDDSWDVTEGASRLVEIYNGEKHDANLEILGWSSITPETSPQRGRWSKAAAEDLPASPTELTASSAAQIRRLNIFPVASIGKSPSGKTILDFGQNLVGYVRLKQIKAPKGQKISLFHAEVLENGECARRPLRLADQLDEYTCRGDPNGEAWEPRFTFHGFRYVQLEGWPTSCDPMTAIDAVVCHTDMQPTSDFSCSDSMLNKLHTNIRWGMRGNFLSIPTDCPQRDERLGWTGDIAMFSPTACFLYDCNGMLSSWLNDLAIEQAKCNGIPPLVIPNVLEHAAIPQAPPTAIWADAAILVPWALYQASGDTAILVKQYESMKDWIKSIPRDPAGGSRLYDTNTWQYGDWLDPAAPPENAADSRTDAFLVANAFLIHSLDVIQEVAIILGDSAAADAYAAEAKAVRQDFADEYLTKNGRLASDTQCAYALGICFDLFQTPQQKQRAGNRLAELARRNAFRIATGFAGTPYVCEALVRTGHEQIAYRMLVEDKCPSWLYPITMGATTIWERWDSMLPDGSLNPGSMTSFNHYALGAIGAFMYERLAGLKCVEPGWKRSRAEPVLGAEFTSASASHLTPYGRASCSWKIIDGEEGGKFEIDVEVPSSTTMEVVLPKADASKGIEVGAGKWSFSIPYKREYDWPPQALRLMDLPT